MIKYFLAVVIVLSTAACNDNSQAPANAAIKDTSAKNTRFFPVTAYIKGQIHAIREKGLTPLKYITANNRTDSAMIRFSELDSLVKEFITPEIDSSNLVSLYNESKFLDQTINSFTYTYDPKKPEPDTLTLLHWDVYLEPETGTVKRVYMIKKAGPGKTLQLTWVHNQWFNTTVIKTGTDGTTSIEKEEKISWDY